MSERDTLWNRIKRAIACSWLGHRFGPATTTGDGISSLFYISTCRRCAHWKSEPSAILGIERSTYRFWRTPHG